MGLVLSVKDDGMFVLKDMTRLHIGYSKQLFFCLSSPPAWVLRNNPSDILRSQKKKPHHLSLPLIFRDERFVPLLTLRIMGPCLLLNLQTWTFPGGGVWFTERQIPAVPSAVIYRVWGDLRSDSELLKSTSGLSPLPISKPQTFLNSQYSPPLADDGFFTPLLCYSCVWS